MDTEAPSMSAHPDSATPTRDPLLLAGLPVYATDSSDDEALDYQAKLEAYQALADDHFETERYAEFCDSTLPHVDDMVLEWIEGPDFRSLLQSTIQQTYPPHEWGRFEGHFGGLLGMWVSDERRIRGADA